MFFQATLVDSCILSDLMIVPILVLARMRENEEHHVKNEPLVRGEEEGTSELERVRFRKRERVRELEKERMRERGSEFERVSKRES